MTKLTIHEAKTHLSKYLLQVQQGQVILICKSKTPIAQLVPISRKKKIKALFGLAKGWGHLGPEFFEPLTDKDLPGFGL